MKGLIILLLLWVPDASSFDVRGKGETVFYADLPNNTAVDICSEDSEQSPEYVRLIQKTANTSLTVSLSGKGMEHMYENGNSGFGISPAEDPDIITIKAWHRDTGLSVKVTINTATGEVVNKETFNDYADVMCYSNGELQHYRGKRGIDWEAVKYALRRACGHFLDYSVAGNYCSLSKTWLCLQVAAALGALVPLPGDSVFWFGVCSAAMFVVCDEIGYRDPTSYQVCATIEQELKDFFG